jgi:transcriptional regulator with XRE-family HTH domain
MEGIKDLREKFGLSQATFADILGITRGQLSLIECSMRNLSTHSLVKIGELEIAQKFTPEFQPDDESRKFLTAQKESYYDNLKKRLNKEQLRLIDLQTQLIKSEEKYKSVCESLRLIGAELKLFDELPSYTHRLKDEFDSHFKAYLKNHPDITLGLKLSIKECEAVIQILQEEILRTDKK